MPEIVITEIPVEAIKPYDKIADNNSSEWPLGATVGMVEVKVKWVYIRDTNGHSIRRVEAGTLVNVARLQKTSEERYAEQRAAAVVVLTQALGRDRSVATLLRSMADNRETSSMQHGDFDELLTLNAQANLWARFGGVVTRVTEQGCGDIVTALAIFANMLQERTDYRNPLSRSTSVTSNLVEDVQWSVEKEFTRDLLMYYGVSDAMLAAELATVKTVN